MSNEELVKRLLAECGGKDNIVTATNCMTRLRIQVWESCMTAATLSRLW